MGASSIHFTKSKQPDPKVYILYNAIYMTYRKGKTTG